MPYISDKRLYLNGDRTKVVTEESPEAAYLLAAEGALISDDDAARYKLGKHAVKAADAEEVESKQVPAPPENKAQTAKQTKAD